MWNLEYATSADLAGISGISTGVTGATRIVPSAQWWARTAQAVRLVSFYLRAASPVCPAVVAMHLQSEISASAVMPTAAAASSKINAPPVHMGIL